MTSLLLIAAAGALFTCANPKHHDGDNIRCNGETKSMRLYGIDAPEMPGACAKGRRCTPGNPYASRDNLTAITRGQRVQCRQIDTDRYGRKIVQCYAGRTDISCAQVRARQAVPRYGNLQC